MLLFSESLRNMINTLSSLQLICESTGNTYDYETFNLFRKNYIHCLSLYLI